MNKQNRPVILMGYSEIAEKFVPVAFPPFPTIRDAEIFGMSWFKTVNWRVAREVIRKHGDETEVVYDFLTDVKKPRRGYDE